MAHYLASDTKYRDPIYDDEQSYCVDQRVALSDYRFARVHGKPARGALHRVYGTFRRLIEAIANSKLRRIERELELRGIRTRNKV
jgi:hypothetical protein